MSSDDVSAMVAGLAEQPPSTNRGVLSTSADSPFISHWLSVTLEVTDYDYGAVDADGVVIPAPGSLRVVENLLGRVELCERNLYRGYTRTAVLACGGRVAWHDEQPGQRLLVDLSGSALEALGQDPTGLMLSLLEVGGQFTRLDVARDDRAGLLDFAEIERKVRAGETTMRFRQWRKYETGQVGGGDKTDGKTLYLGNPSSTVTARIYDKGAEQHQHGDWVRVELQFRAEAAHKLAEYVCAAVDQGQWLAGVFANYLDFKEPGEDSNKSRWQTSAWWQEFLQASSKVRLGLSRSLRKFQEVQAWAYRQMSIVLASFDQIDASFFDVLLEQGQKALLGRDFYSKRLERWLQDFKLAGSFSPA